MPPTPDPIAGSVWLRPARPRRGRPQLSREEIVGAAIEILDADGLDGLSMRRLAAHLSAGATSAYFYVATKDELLELAVDEIMGEIDIPDPAGVGWRTAAAALAGGLRGVILRHTWLTGLLGVHPAIGPNALRIGERSAAVLTAAGFAGKELAWASSLLTAHAVGAATAEAALQSAMAQAGKNAADLLGQLHPYIESVAGEYPMLAAWFGQNESLDVAAHQDAAFAFGLERVLDGLESWLKK
ncbi:TetR/AcrR family transcriptional regulator [Spirillospora sp. NBC_01491]|uniref:TetR/AcrR family transcriptional regulator n=1 Tax=Spirillospora sp. NBC_01491 TaxID=2976007 RepID=UPI002E3797DE|nr:TetR/AcrR family transcriptional regulator [Spirillospora sp. NBC_01491]